MRKNNIVFVIFVSLFLVFGFFSFVRTEKELSYKENRYLQKFPHFTISSFFNGSYQSNLEAALTDQFVGGETIKEFMNNFFSPFDIPESGVLCENKYFRYGDYYTYNCDSAFVKFPSVLDANLEKEFSSRIEMYNSLNDYIDTYYYFISDSEIFDFTKNDYSINFLNILDSMNSNYHLSSFSFNNYDEYKKYFYNTDHHWNNYASYKGYVDIMKMIDPSIEVLIPNEEFTFDFSFLGSSSRLSNYKKFKDNFSVYKFDIGEHIEYVNRNVSLYGKSEEYFNDIYVSDLYTNHYGEFFCWDYGEVIFDFKNDKLDNLLILSNSFSNPINELIASHFNKTYVIDLRHYENSFGEVFDIKKYISDNSIDKVLIIGNYEYFSDGTFDFVVGG